MEVPPKGVNADVNKPVEGYVSRSPTVKRDAGFARCPWRTAGGSLVSSPIPRVGVEVREQRGARRIADLPAVAGVYLFKDARGEVLYVGKA
jgi:hypothetical protein